MCQSGVRRGQFVLSIFCPERWGDIYNEVSIISLQGTASDWHTITLFLIVNLMPPAFSVVFGVKLLHIFHPPFSWRRLMVDVEFICWEQQSFMWKYSALISSCSIDLWFNALHSPGADEIIFLNHGKYADLWIFPPNMVTLCILQCVQWIYTTPPSLTPSLRIICLATAHYITASLQSVHVWRSWAQREKYFYILVIFSSD